MQLALKIKKSSKPKPDAFLKKFSCPESPASFAVYITLGVAEDHHSLLN